MSFAPEKICGDARSVSEDPFIQSTIVFHQQSPSPVCIKDAFGVQPNKVLDLIRAMIGHCQ